MKENGLKVNHMDMDHTTNFEALFTKDNGIKTYKMVLELSTLEMAQFMKASSKMESNKVKEN
jgi:hypothetical protein